MPFKTCFFLLLSLPLTAVAGETFTPMFEAYHQLQTALAGDDLAAAKKATETLETATDEIAASSLQGAQKTAWQAQSEQLTTALDTAGSAASIEALRKAFEPISVAIIAIADVVEPAGFREFTCPMAFGNKGANWLQKSETIANPYFGSAMLRCGAPVP